MRPATAPPRFAALIFAGAVLLLAFSSASAQLGADHLEQYIARTAEIIDWAADQVAETENQQARRVFDEAKNLHSRSMEMADNGRPANAMATSRRARQAAEQAARLAREAHSEEVRVQLRLERFQEYRDQIAERARDAGDERALRFVSEAEDQAIRAHDHYRQGNHDLAAHLIESAEDLLSRAGRLLFEGGGTERWQRELERTRLAIDAIAERLAATDDGVARDLLDSAETALERADEFARRGRPLRAMRTLRLARRLAGQAAGQADEGLDAQSVQTQLDRLDARVELMTEQMESTPSASARESLERARHHRDEAANLLDGGELESSLRHIKAAFDLLNAARDLTR